MSNNKLAFTKDYKLVTSYYKQGWGDEWSAANLHQAVVSTLEALQNLGNAGFASIIERSFGPTMEQVFGPCVAEGGRATQKKKGALRPFFFFYP